MTSCIHLNTILYIGNIVNCFIIQVMLENRRLQRTEKSKTNENCLKLVGGLGSCNFHKLLNRRQTFNVYYRLNGSKLILQVRSWDYQNEQKLMSLPKTIHCLTKNKSLSAVGQQIRQVSNLMALKWVAWSEHPQGFSISVVFIPNQLILIFPMICVYTYFLQQFYFYFFPH